MQSERAHRVMYDGLYTFVVRLAKIGLTAALAVITARALGPAGRGVYALPGVEAALVASAFGGLTSATTYFLLNRSPGAVFLRPVLLSTFLLTAAAALVLVPLTYLAHQPGALIPALAVLPSLALLNLASGYALGVHQVRFSTTIAALQTVFTIAATVAAFVIVERSPGIAIIAWVAGTSLAGAVSLAYIVRHARRHLAGADTIGFREYWAFCMKVTAVNVVSLLNYRADLYIVALFLPPAALGMYSIAVAGAESLLVPTQVAALVTSPHIGGMEVHEAAVLTARCVRHNLLIALLICVPLFVLAAPVVQLLYGAKFLPLVPSFDVLLIGVIVLALSSPLSSYFTLKIGIPGVALRLASLSALVCIATTFALVHRYGMVGAAIGSSAGYLVGQSVGIWYFRKRSAIGLRSMLVPTGADLLVYWAFLARMLRDGRRLLHPAR